jgi:hypothetical protein
LKRFLGAALALSLLAGPAVAQPADDWITVKAGTAFTFEAPPDLHSVPVQGIDSFVGEYQGDHFSLQFDYGLYSNRLDELRADSRFEREAVMIDGRPADIFTGPGPTKDCAFEVAVYVVADPTGPVALQMGGCANGYAGVVQMHRLMKSLKFTRP